MTVMDIMSHQTPLPHDDLDASPPFDRAGNLIRVIELH